jgi:hypothetical protein
MSEQIAVFQLKTVLILYFVKYINIHIYNKLIIKFNEKFIKTQTSINSGTTVLTCQNSCSSSLTCSGGCSISNGQYIGNYIQTSCCSSDYCNEITVTSSTQSATVIPYAIVTSCYVGIEPILNISSCPTGSTDLCKVNATLVLFKETLFDR